jgi:hypothetical protein
MFLFCSLAAQGLFINLCLTIGKEAANYQRSVLKTLKFEKELDELQRCY